MSKHKKQAKAVHEEASKNPSPSPLKRSLKNIYVLHYKRLFLIVVALALFALASVAYTYYKHGDFTQRDVSLKGGLSLTLTTKYSDTRGLDSFLNGRFPQSSLNIRTVESGGVVKGLIVEASDVSEQDLIRAIEEKTGKLGKDDYSVEQMGSSLGESFFKEMFVSLLLAFFCMGLVFHFYFRNFYATFAALLSAFLDIFITLGIMNIIGMRLTAGGIAAYLMLIGYSVDTSILLSTKLIKEKSDDTDKALFRAMKTGLTMSAAGIAATGISFLLTNNLVLKQIMLILIVGLFVDIITTWIGNVTLLKLYLEKKNA